MSSNRITTREFFKALLEIKPQLEVIENRLAELQQWATGEDGMERRFKEIALRIDALERRHVQEDERKKVVKMISGFLHAVIYGSIALVSAFIGKGL